MSENDLIRRFNFLSPKIIFGNDTLNELGKITSEMGTRALIVSGQHAMQKYGILNRIIKDLETYNIETFVFNQVEPEVSCDTVDLGKKFANENNIDIIIGIGGGSALDCGKAIAIMMTHEGETWEYQDNKKISHPGTPYIAIPTTAGTGSEVTKNAVLINRSTNWKASIRHPSMTPKVAIIDPKLTLTLPPNITAYTGMDALTQAIEAYVSLKSNPLSDVLAEKAISLIASNLENAVKNGENLEYREKMALGSLISALAFSNSGLGGVHGIAHPIGADFKIPHGKLCAILLPLLMEYNRDYNKSKFMIISKLLNPKSKSIIDGIDFIYRLNQSINIPKTLKDYNISPEEFKLSINKARGGSFNANPRPIDKEELVEFLISRLF
ncbi:MAG: iron-containing alcohol dehydrogenase family protein [Candidatus Helarchaeota archaeon]